MPRLVFSHSPVAIFLSCALILAGCSDSSDQPTASGDNVGSTVSCDEQAARALQVCLEDMNAAQRACYTDSDGPCEDTDGGVLAAQDELEGILRASCADGGFLNLTQDALVGRLQNACRAHSDSFTWRTFGGPFGVVWSNVSGQDRTCLVRAHEIGSVFLNETLEAVNGCLGGEECDVPALRSATGEAAASASSEIAAACPALEPLISLTPEVFVERAEDQIDCLMSTAHRDASVLEPMCGPSNVDQMPARGEWTQIVLDGDKWGTLCGDGGPYAIQVRLAPEGYPVDNILLALAGGGVCLFESDCKASLANSPELFSAVDDEVLVGAGGIASDSPDNPFANWTRAYFPYCNRDVFIGGGTVESFPGLDLPRYGAINLRSGVRVVQDILWKYLDETTDTGFRPDQLLAMFGGFSAGAYGTLFNYHWILDDLQWPRTAAYPDAGGALDNGSPAGITGLPALKIPAWGTQPYLPPYCVDGECVVGPVNYEIMSPRLKKVPEQQYLILSNQKDTTQQGDAFFTDEAQWIDAMRSAYCETKDLQGIQWYLTSDSVNSVHVVSIRDEFYYGDVAGERMVDWLWRAVSDPDSISDWAEEGNFTSDIPGSNPFPCELP